MMTNHNKGLRTFNPVIAEYYSLNAAVVADSITRKCRANQGSFTHITFEELGNRHPYFARGTIQNALAVLLTGTPTAPALLRRQLDGRKVRYALVGELPRRRLEKFDSRLACDVGIIPAMAYETVAEGAVTALFDLTQPTLSQLPFADEKVRMAVYRQSAHLACFRFWIDEWLRSHPYVSGSTVQRALARLSKQRLLEKIRGGFWTIPQKDLWERIRCRELPSPEGPMYVRNN